MFVLIKNKITGEYKTIYRKDINVFKNLHSFFKQDTKLPEGVVPNFNFDIIEDRQEIKKILDEHFTSKGRGEEYDEDLPSASKIAYSLFPIHINSEKFLIRYWNNTELKDQVGERDLILSRGTFAHKILELWVLDKESRVKDKEFINKIKKSNQNTKKHTRLSKQIDSKITSDIRKYIQLAYKDPEIIQKIPNIEDIKEELEFLVVKCLPDFIKNELIFSDTVYSEIFLCINGFIQGSIDSVVYKDGKFKIVDYKTTSSIDKNTGKPKFKSNSQLAPFARQLYIYNELLKRTGMTHLFDYENPEYEIMQIHLVSGKYKKFNISQGLIESQGKIVERVLKWYWDIRNEKFDLYEQYDKDDEYTDDSLDLGIISL